MALGWHFGGDIEWGLNGVLLWVIPVSIYGRVRKYMDNRKTQDVVQAALTARTDGRLRMTESYRGIVRHVGKDDVVVLFEVDDDLVEHTYTRGQFVDSRMPEEGDRLAVFVHVVQLPTEESAETADETTEGTNEVRRRRRNVLRGEEEF